MLRVVFMLALAGTCFAQEEEDSAPYAAPVPKMPRGGGALLSDMAAQSRRMKVEQARMMRAMRMQANPAASAETAGNKKQIDAILDKLSKGQVKEDEARKQLQPLVRKEIQPELDGLKERIQRLEQKAAQLRQAQNNPDRLVDHRVRELILSAEPSPLDTPDPE